MDSTEEQKSFTQSQAVEMPTPNRCATLLYFALVASFHTTTATLFGEAQTDDSLKPALEKMDTDINRCTEKSPGTFGSFESTAHL